MGAYCLLGVIPSHTVSIGEIMEVLWSDYHGAIIFGDREEVACIPHAGCRLEIVATPPPALTARSTFSCRDRSSDTRTRSSSAIGSSCRVSLRHLVGFKLQLASSVALPPREDAVVRRRLMERAGTRPDVCPAMLPIAPV